MKCLYLFFFLGVLVFCSDGYNVSKKLFPEHFQFGVATAAFQTEGAWNESGKGESIWDHFLHTQPNRSKDSLNGDVACDSYHKMEEDIKNLKELGVKVYRFSLSWPRLLPRGDLSKVNEKGVAYYLTLLQKLKENGIQTMVSLYHWDYPQAIFNPDGWLNSAAIHHFQKYAQFCFGLFGKYVDYWATINEPKSVCMWGYGTGIHAPGYTSIGEGVYQCAHNIILAHARAWHLYDMVYRPLYNGKVSIVLDQTWGEPASEDPLDIEAAEIENEFGFGWFANPIYIGNYPQVMIDRIGNRSEREGYDSSRLPAFTDAQIKYIKGTYDFFGLNLYTGTLVTHTEEAPIGSASYWNDKGCTTAEDPKRPVSGLSWLVSYPEALRDALNYVNKKYMKGGEIWVTENGWTDMTGELNDLDRISYHKQYLSAVQDAIYEDEINVVGYTLWSLMDNLEWAEGYTQKFGIIQVDFNNPNRTRTWKDSARWYKKLIATRCLEDQCTN